MNKTLFISDMDGTLLNSDQKLSENTVQKINSLIAQGMNFTVATARSYASAKNILKPLDLKVPVIMHNGVFVYDIAKETYIYENLLQNETASQIFEILKESDSSPFLFTKTIENKFHTYYTGINNDSEENYTNSRLKKNDNRFQLVTDFEKGLSEKIILILIIDTKAKIDNLYEQLKDRFDLTYHRTEDIYTKGYYWFEITNKNATKKDGVLFLKEKLKANKIVCFGDNLNDISMFEIADEKYAVENAYQELKNVATKVIDSNENDGVANFLEEYYKNKQC